MRSKRAFTLIELVMVIAILGILAAMVIPRFIDLQSRARISAAQGTLGSIRAAIAATYASNAANGVTPLIPATITASMFQDNRIPMEPFSNASTISFVADVSNIGAGSGWAYDSTNGRVWINNSQYTTY